MHCTLKNISVFMHCPFQTFCTIHQIIKSLSIQLSIVCAILSCMHTWLHHLSSNFFEPSFYSIRTLIFEASFYSIYYSSPVHIINCMIYLNFRLSKISTINSETQVNISITTLHNFAFDIEFTLHFKHHFDRKTLEGNHRTDQTECTKISEDSYKTLSYYIVIASQNDFL